MTINYETDNKNLSAAFCAYVLLTLEERISMEALKHPFAFACTNLFICFEMNCLFLNTYPGISI